MLERIKCPNDVKQLNIEELNILAKEIREIIINSVKKNGGHLSSNLGMVETTIAAYYVFDIEKDKFIFDVGHQSYTHKILSGRLDLMDDLRQEGGISGFTDPKESKFDSFVSGHAGDTMALSLGMLEARDFLKQDYSVIDVIGDGTMVNGLTLEAITASKEKPDNYFVIMNDNGMSISQNSNGLYKSIINSTTQRPYVYLKKALKQAFDGSKFGDILKSIRDFFNRLFNPHFYIDATGLKYIGPVNGHNIKELIKVFTRAKENKHAAFIHIHTVKGKGFEEAEKHPDLYHSIGKGFLFGSNTFSNTLGNSLVELARKDERVCAICAGMKLGTGLNEFEKEFPNRFYDVGISEEYAVSFAAGLAKAGMRPYVCVYSTFLQRSYDEIFHDVCVQDLPVVFCIDKAGVVGNDGIVHQGMFDISFLRHIPNISIMAPKDSVELEEMISYSIDTKSPIAIRYPNGSYDNMEASKPFEFNWNVLSQGEEVSLLCVGRRMIDLALKVKEKCPKVEIVNARIIKPLDIKYLMSIKDRKIITLEENVLAGGFGSSVLEFFSSQNISANVKCFGLQDSFIRQGTIQRQLELNGITEDNIINEINGEAI